MKNNSLGNLDFSQTDISAILCAIPLVSQFETDFPAQKLINAASSESAVRKLLNHAPTFTADEVRVISCAISAAMSVISGDDMADMFDVDTEWTQDLSRYFFTFTRLEPIFDGLVDEIQRRLH